jgi:NADP-dependent 3-hydroxy acid dehydrogenase YdfG
MIIGITGDSIGIGKALKDMLIAQGHVVKGFSRSNGYDVSDAKIQNKIIEKLVDCDIFINNAYAGVYINEQSYPNQTNKSKFRTVKT